MVEARKQEENIKFKFLEYHLLTRIKAVVKFLCESAGSNIGFIVAGPVPGSLGMAGRLIRRCLRLKPHAADSAEPQGVDHAGLAVKFPRR